MSIQKLLQKTAFVLNYRYYKSWQSFVRKSYYKLLGMKVGAGTHLSAVAVTWPHQVSLGSNCLLEHNTAFKFDGIWQQGPNIVIGDSVFIGSGCEFNIRSKITIGRDSLIASGCKFVDHDHGIQIGTVMRTQHGAETPIFVGSDVWLGANVIILKGVVVGNGAIVAAGAIVTKSVPDNEIWAGVPAKKIGQRT